MRREATRAARTSQRDPTSELLRLQTLYGYNAHSLVSITPGARLWSPPDIDGAIVYSVFGRVWLAVGDPLADEGDAGELARAFLAAARRQRRLAAFIPATEGFARAGVAAGLSAVKVGAAPYFDLRTWAPRGDRAKKMRSGVNQAQRSGVKVETVSSADAEIRRETDALCRRWLKTRRSATEFGWLFVLDPFQHAERKRFFAARDGRGRLVGLLAASPIPAREGWYLEDILRLPDAPPARRTYWSSKRSRGSPPGGRNSRRSARRRWRRTAGRRRRRAITS